MILADTSAWVEFLRATGSTVQIALRNALADGEVAVCGAVRMEVLAGARDVRHAAQLKSLLALPAQIETTDGDFDLGADVYLRCRQSGDTPRSMTDCLIAAVAIGRGLAVLHHDRAFVVMARHTGLALIP